jgi:hypothetical protein
VLARVGEIEDDLVLHPLLEARALRLQVRHPADHVDHQVETVDLVQDRELERRVDAALLLVAAHVQVLVVLEPAGELVDQPRVAVEVEDHRAVAREQTVELALGRTVRMLAGRLQLEQVDDVHEAHAQVGQVLAPDSVWTR